MMLILWAIGIPLELQPNPSPWLILGFNLAQELLGAVFFIYLISNTVQTTITGPKIVVTVLTYLFVWILTNLHTIVILFEAPAAAVSPIIGIATVLIIYLLAFYFFFIPYLTEDLNLIKSIRSSNLIVLGPRILALRIICTALAVSLLIRQTFQFFKLPSINFPLEYAFVLDMLSTFSQPTYWAITTLMCIGLIPILSNRKLKYEVNLKSHNGIGFFILGGAGIGKILLSVLLLGAGSVYLTLTAPPDFSLSINKSSYNKEQKLFNLDLHIKSNNGSLANLQPMFFRIASDDGYPFSEIPSKIEPTQSISAIASGVPEVWLNLTFEIINRQDDFDKLEDKTLWYLNHKIQNIP
jgi:hypothetical protein